MLFSIFFTQFPLFLTPKKQSIEKNCLILIGFLINCIQQGFLLDFLGCLIDFFKKGSFLISLGGLIVFFKKGFLIDFIRLLHDLVQIIFLNLLIRLSS